MTRKNVHIFGSDKVANLVCVGQVGGEGPFLPLIACFQRGTFADTRDFQAIIDHPDTTVWMFEGHAALFGMLTRLAEMGYDVSRQMEGKTPMGGPAADTQDT